MQQPSGVPHPARVKGARAFGRARIISLIAFALLLWDEINVTLPPAIHSQALVERIHNIVVEQTAESARVAEHEWKRGKRDDGLGRFSAAPVVNLRPSVAGISMRVRYVTRASRRLEVRSRLYRAVVDVMQTEKTIDRARQSLDDGI